MKYIIGNWKMNGNKQLLLEMLNAITQKNSKNQVILCVPYTMLQSGTDIVSMGAQNISTHEFGPYTGEISAEMVYESGARYVILGHSEVREYHNESDSDVYTKANIALKYGLTPIICVGETAQERDQGLTQKIIEQSLRKSLPDCLDKKIIIAYEPRWAIGRGITPSYDDISRVHLLIHTTVKSLGYQDFNILYGASVKPDNVMEIMSLKYVDGVLVGGASLKKDEFISIITNVK
ncbi:MAG: triose-phosphate isomerase [Alphaproteobacteria bacterium]